jgi:hypothetical protein
MQTQSTAFRHELERLIQEYTARLKDELAANTLNDISQVRIVQGQIMALSNMAGLMDDADIRADQRNR